MASDVVRLHDGRRAGSGSVGEERLRAAHRGRRGVDSPSDPPVGARWCGDEGDGERRVGGDVSVVEV